MKMKPHFASEYGPGVSLQANAVAYELTQCGDTVRGKPETWAELERQVNECLDAFCDRIPPMAVARQLKHWLRVNEQSGGR